MTGRAYRSWAVAVAIGGGILPAAGAQAVDATADSRPVIRVNDRELTASQFESRHAAEVTSLRLGGLDAEQRQEQIESARRSVARQMYEELLLLAKADELELAPPAEEIEQTFSEAAAAPAFQAKLDGQSREVRLRAVAQLRSEIERKITAREVLRREVGSRIEITVEEVAEYYRAHPDEFREPGRLRVREVVVLAHPERPFAETAEVALQLHASILAGRSLEQAVQEQVATALVTRPIDLGWVGREDVDAGLQDALWSTPVGGVTPPLRGRGGLHLMQVLERGELEQRPYDQVKVPLRSNLALVRLGRAVHLYLAGLESRFDIEIAPSMHDLLGADAPPAVAQAPAPSDPTTLVAATVRAWAEAWSNQRVDAYLAHYSAEFEPPNGLDRPGWERQRRSRIERPASIRVSIDALQIELNGAGRVTARFRQSYASDSYRDEVAKRLELVWENGGWKILEEMTEN